MHFIPINLSQMILPCIFLSLSFSMSFAWYDTEQKEIALIAQTVLR